MGLDLKDLVEKSFDEWAMAEVFLAIFIKKYRNSGIRTINPEMIASTMKRGTGNWLGITVIKED
jgi:hypothetical protein